MGVIWTPWRLEFIVGPKPADCIFCVKPREARDRENYIVARGESVFVILNAYPYANGHLMVVPYEHVGSLEDVPAATAAEMMRLTQASISALRRAYAPDGFNIGANLGRAAGAGIADHCHLHVVPRWNGDSNFMGVLGQTRLIPELLADTFDRLTHAGLTPP